MKSGTRKGPCRHNHEFDVEKDKGVGCSFWDGKADEEKAEKRMKAVRDLFKKHYPDMEYDLEEPACDFDMYYDGEDKWPINHTGAIAPSRGFSWSKAQDMKKTTTTPRPAGAGPAPMTCKEIGCGSRGTRCDCNSMCKKYNDCCADYKDLCLADHAKPDHTAVAHHQKDVTKVERAEPSQPANHHHDEAASKAHSKGTLKQELSAACKEAQQECSKAVRWAKTSGFYEHPEWYKGLTATSTDEDFQKLLAKTHRGSCDKLCRSNGMYFLKKKLK